MPIQRGGVVEVGTDALPAEAAGVLEGTAALYDLVGFSTPWICYIAILENQAVGTCGFKSAPDAGRAEIAYFTFPAFEGRGIATQMASRLLALAAETDRSVIIAAQTLRGRNASHRVLEKLGFTCTGTVEHPEDGTVLEWRKIQG